MVATKENRLKFIQSTITLLRTFRFDGINLDWRNPGHTECQQDDELNFTLLCQVRSGAFHLPQKTSCHAVKHCLLMLNVNTCLTGAQRGLSGWEKWVWQPNCHCHCICGEKNHWQQLWSGKTRNVKSIDPYSLFALIPCCVVLSKITFFCLCLGIWIS